jgi:hypothetical protein
MLSQARKRQNVDEMARLMTDLELYEMKLNSLKGKRVE